MSTVDQPGGGVDLALPGAPPTPAQLLGLVARTFPDADHQGLVDVQVTAAQLVGNAYRHAGAPRRLRLSPSRDRDLVRIDVDDGSPGLLPVLGRLGAPGDGCGLLVVNRLAVNWGHESRDGRKTVWAEVRLA